MNLVFTADFEKAEASTFTRKGETQTGIKANAPFGSKFLYIAERSDGMLKIGVSKNVYRRLKAIKYAASHVGSDVSFGRVSFTTAIKEYEKLEIMIFESFSLQRTTGEWFAADFEVVQSELAGLVDRFVPTQEPDSEMLSEARAIFGDVAAHQLAQRQQRRQPTFFDHEMIKHANGSTD
ncbi:MAG: GIY-YIG nuclease family protein [Pseudomonadota bacterium]